MRVFGAAVALAALAPACAIATSNILPNKSSAHALSSASKPVDACGPEVVTIYETVYGGDGPKSATSSVRSSGCSAKATPLSSKPHSTKIISPSGRSSSSSYEARPTGKVAKPFGQNKDYFHHDSEGDVELQPCNHWDYNTKDPKNLVPSSKAQIYYAEGGRENARPTNEFYFGVIDLFFKAPAVVLEHSPYINDANYANNELVVDFSSAVACDFASESWKKGTIIVSTTAKCGVSSDDDQCYFKVEDVVKSDDGKSAIVKGRPQARDECTEGGEAHWGRYKPKKDTNATTSNTGFPSPNGSYHGFSKSSSNAAWPTTVSYSFTTKSFGSDGLFTLYTSTLAPTGTSHSYSSRPTVSTTAFPASNTPGLHFSDSAISTSLGKDASSDSHPFLTTSFQNSASQTLQSSVSSSTGIPSPDAPDDGNKGFGDEPPVCKAPVDAKYNLPTACTGQFFDLD